MFIRRIGSRCVLACIVWACAILLAGCATAPSSGPSVQAPAEPTPLILGFWIDGLGLYSERHTANVGVFVRPCREVTLNDIHSLYAEMTDAPIVGTFRSSREAHVVARNLHAATGIPVIWVHATYNGNWVLSLETPPVKDHNEIQESRTPEEQREYDEFVPIGEPDAGIHPYQTIVYVLPPPLEQRGICLTRIYPMGRALHYVNPPDTYTSIFASFEETQRALRETGDFSVTRWREGKRVADSRP